MNLTLIVNNNNKSDCNWKRYE